jgi:hypothetical protein
MPCHAWNGDSDGTACPTALPQGTSDLAFASVSWLTQKCMACPPKTVRAQPCGGVLPIRGLLNSKFPSESAQYSSEWATGESECLPKLPCATHLLPSHPEAVTVVSSPECLGILAQKMIDASAKSVLQQRGLNWRGGPLCHILRSPPRDLTTLMPLLLRSSMGRRELKPVETEK